MTTPNLVNQARAALARVDTAGLSTREAIAYANAVGQLASAVQMAKLGKTLETTNKLLGDELAPAVRTAARHLGGIANRNPR